MIDTGRRAGMQRQGLTAKEACDNFWIADYRGLITSEREDLSDTVAPFARSPGAGDTDGEALADIVRRVRAAGFAAADAAVL
jgi:Malic enzyme, NAD binding domain